MRVVQQPRISEPRSPAAYNKSKCLTLEKCVRCIEICSAGAIKVGAENRIRGRPRDRQLIRPLCTQACPSQALNFYGETMTVAKVIRAAEEDGVFYSRSGGRHHPGGR